MLSVTIQTHFAVSGDVEAHLDCSLKSTQREVLCLNEYS